MRSTASARGRTRALVLIPLPTEKGNVDQRDVPVQLQGVWVRPGADGTRRAEA